MATAVDKSPAYARLSTVASAGDLPTAPTPPQGTRPFRGKTPLGALHAIRLEQVHGELRLGATGASIATVARRYGWRIQAVVAMP